MTTTARKYKGWRSAVPVKKAALIQIINGSCELRACTTAEALRQIRVLTIAALGRGSGADFRSSPTVDSGEIVRRAARQTL